MDKIKVLVADDHAIVRTGLVSLLSRSADIDVVGEASNGSAAVTKSARLMPDVVIMDLIMPKLDGAEATRQIVEVLPDTKVVILTSYGTSSDLVRAITNGAVGAQMKGSPVETLLKAIRVVASGGKAIAAEIQRFLREDTTPTDLSKRQREVLIGVSQGRTSDQIAVELGISVSAVKQHITAACEKLGASSRAEAVTIAMRRNLLKI